MLNFKYYEYMDTEKKCKAIKAVTTYEGKTVSGVAYLHPDDSYDYEIGKKIAELRCTLKVTDKKIKRFNRKSRGVQRELVSIVEYMGNLTDILSTYENIIESANKEKTVVQKELQEVLENIS